MKNLKKVAETAKKSVAAKVAANKKAEVAKRAGTVSAKRISATTKTKENTMATKKEATKKAAPKQAADPGIEYTKESLLALGEEMNTLLFPDEPVNFSKMETDDILAQIKADAGNIDPKDNFSDESKETLAAIGVDVEWVAPKVPAAAKETQKAAPVKKEGAAKKSGPPRQASPESIARKAMIKELIEEAKHTGADILAKVMKKYPDTKESSVKTILSDSKNEKYTPFGKTAKINDKGHFSF